MNQQNDQKLSSDKTRRKFLKRSATGIVLASLPAKSVWATGVTGSMVASGHGSDMAGGRTLSLMKPNQWAVVIGRVDARYRNAKFSKIFGGRAFKDNKGNYFSNDLTIEEVLVARDGKKSTYRGPKNVNRLLVSAYLSACYTGTLMFDTHFPVVGRKRAFRSESQLAAKLYYQASLDPKKMGRELGMLHDDPMQLVAMKH